MLGLLRDQSRSAAGAIWYVTVGTLMVIWASLWYFYFLFPDPNSSPTQRFICAGLVLSGLAVGAIGLMFGAIGRSSKGADTTVGVAASERVISPSAITSHEINMPTVVETTEVVPSATGRIQTVGR